MTHRNARAKFCFRDDVPIASRHRKEGGDRAASGAVACSQPKVPSCAAKRSLRWAAKVRQTGIALAFLILPFPAIACWDDAAARYGVNAHLLYAIAKTESSLNPNAINRNRNGSYDIGLMQINSTWFPILKKYGVEEQHLYDPCTSIHVGAWILSDNMRRLGNSWNAVGAYNTSKPDLRLKYAKKVYRNLPPEVIAGYAE